MEFYLTKWCSIVKFKKKKKVAADQIAPFHLQMDQVRGEGGEGWRALEQASRGHAVIAQLDGA